MAVREQLYDLVEPFDTGFLNVTDVHTLHYEQAGNPVSHIIPFLAHAQCLLISFTTLEWKPRSLRSWWSWRWHWPF
jgi:hypothetical protein